MFDEKTATYTCALLYYSDYRYIIEELAPNMLIGLELAVNTHNVKAVCEMLTTFWLQNFPKVMDYKNSEHFHKLFDITSFLLRGNTDYYDLILLSKIPFLENILDSNEKVNYSRYKINTLRKLLDIEKNKSIAQSFLPLINRESERIENGK